jgi:prepilin-type N-terminal cleavage/methylation domain-containing protein
MIGDKKGFTLIETMVAVGLFGVVIASASGIFASSLSAQGRSLQLKRVQEEVRFISEFLQKEARQGVRNFQNACPSIVDKEVFKLISLEEVRFQNSRGECVGYRLSGTVLERSVNDGSTWDNLSSPDVLITQVRFLLVGITNPVLDYSITAESFRKGRVSGVSLNVKSNVSPRAY